MGYRISYGPKKHRKRDQWRFRMLYISAAIGFLLVGAYLMAEQEIISRFLLPGDPDVTAAALNNMVRDLRSGETFSQAFACFCREILDGANLS